MIAFPLQLTLVLSSFAYGSLFAAARTASHLNPIEAENRLKGTDHWEIKVLSYHREIEGYPSTPSIAPGRSISFSVSTTGSTFKADVYRMGWYDGKGARHMLHIKKLLGHLRPMPQPKRHTGLIACHWPVSFSITIPHDWISGVYMVKLTASSGHQGYIPFVVTALSSHSPLLFVHGAFTDEAYNTWGGKSLYADIRLKSPAAQYANRAVKVSLQRPFEQSMGAGWFFSWEIHMVRWLERKGYDVTYATDLDVHQHPRILLNHKGVLVVGHDEYWSRAMRDGMDRAVRRGVDLGNFAANTGFWQIRLAPLGKKPDRVIVCYKSATRDPLYGRHNALVTTEWRFPPVNRPESELTGAMYGGYDGSHAPYDWIVTNPSNWIFRGTGLHRRSRIRHVVGQEADYVHHDYPLPRHLHVLTSSPFLDVDSGQWFNANSTIYQAKSGAWVFNAGTIEWSWGLDDIRQNYWLYPAGRKHPSKAAEKITSNILRKFLRSPRG